MKKQKHKQKSTDCGHKCFEIRCYPMPPFVKFASECGVCNRQQWEQIYPYSMMHEVMDVIKELGKKLDFEFPDDPDKKK